MYNYWRRPQPASASPAAAGALLFHFSCSHCSEGSPAKTPLYNNKILALAGCSPNVAKQTVSAPDGRKCLIFNVFDQFSLKPDFFNFAPLRSLHGTYAFAHMPIWRCQKCYIFPMIFSNFTFCGHATFKNLALTNGFGYIFISASILQDRHQPWSSLIFTLFQSMHIFPVVFHCFHVHVAWCGLC